MRILTIFIGILFCFLSAGAQMESGVINAFKSNDASALEKFLDDKVDITFEGQNRVYSRNDASRFFENYFTTNRIKTFRLIHKSESSTTSYYIGELVTSYGNNRLMFFIKNKDGKPVLQEVKIEK